MKRPFTFDNKYYVFKGDVLDLSVINAEVPTPDALVDIEVALTEWKRDLINVRDTYSMGQPSIEGNFRILLNHRDWCLFWSIRHPNPAVRDWQGHALREFNGSIERVAAKARACLQRRMKRRAWPSPQP
jgi:hypothetical protein